MDDAFQNISIERLNVSNNQYRSVFVSIAQYLPDITYFAQTLAVHTKKVSCVVVPRLDTFEYTYPDTRVFQITALSGPHSMVPSAFTHAFFAVGLDNVMAASWGPRNMFSIPLFR